MKLSTDMRKLTMLLAVAGYFAIGYLAINAVSPFLSAHSLSTALDERLPFVPIFIVVYLLGYPLPVVPYFIVKDRSRFERVVMAYFFVLTVSFLVFLIYPAKIIRPEPSGMSYFYAWIYGFQHAADGPYNTFPSLHVSMATIATLACFDWHKKHAWMLVWPVLIAVAALLIKQHFIYDVVGGMALGVITYLMFFNTRTRLVRRG